MADINVRTLVKDVTTAGTEVPLSATSLEVFKVVIQAKAGNTGDIYVGDSTVTSTTGLVLDGGEQVIIDPGKGYVDLAQIYIDSGTNGDGVVVFYYR